MNSFGHMIAYFHAKRYQNLFSSLVLLILIPPFVLTLPYLQYLIYLLVTIVLLTCFVILLGHAENKNLILSASLVVLVFLWYIIINHEKSFEFGLVKNFILAALFMLTFKKVVSEIFSLKKVSFQVVLGAVGAYLLLGLTGAVLFEIVDLIYPNSFSNEAIFSGFYAELYLSFITISTLGYGDITPISPQGQAAAIFVAISGQLYLTILMAMLVGKFLKDTDW